MTAISKISDPTKEKASADMMTFLSDFSGLLDQHISTVRKILLGTVDQAMASVMAINATADFKMKKADEILVQDKSTSFVSKSAKEINLSAESSADKVKRINESLSAHMANLSNLDDSVRGFLFAIMGGLSIDDVVRQRLEHVSTSLSAMRVGVQKVLDMHGSDEKVSDRFIESVQQEMLLKMYRAYTMEEEKKIFLKIFGVIPGINQKP